MMDGDSQLFASPLSTADCPTQRWRLGRSYWRHDRDEGFQKRNFTIALMEQKPARQFIESHHYSGSFPFALAQAGLFCGRELVGVAVFSTPINRHALTRYAGLDAGQGIELGRFVLLDNVPYNAETFFLAGAFDEIRKELPQAKAVLAYSDPVPRITDTGEVRMPGHIGVIYQANNGAYVGRSTPQTNYLTASGQALSTRGLSKIRLQEFGASSAEKRLVQLGASPRRPHQEPGEWVDQVLAGPTFRKVRHPGNHVYVWPLGGKKLKRRLVENFAPRRPYPKSLDPHQGSLLAL